MGMARREDTQCRELSRPNIIQISRKPRAIQVTAVYQRDGAVALARSQIIDPNTALYELLGCAKGCEELGIELIWLEINPTTGGD